jgi:hypothetical protein
MNITRDQYDALLQAALTLDTKEVLRIRDIVDTANSISRYVLYLRWQDVGGTPPRRIELGKPWPEDSTKLLEMDRPISKQDVLAVVTRAAANPVSIMVTPDRLGVVGWTLIDDFVF